MRNRSVHTLSAADRRFADALLIAADPALLVFNKPAGLACQTRNPGDPSLDRLLWAFAKSNGKRPHLVHRLDRETSGVILAARTKPAAAMLHAAFEKRRIQKVYYALVANSVREKRVGRIIAPLAARRDGALVYSAVVDPGSQGARPAETGWERIAAAGGVGLLRVAPRTGRMHQIRAHLSHAGMPILGDRIYGRPTPSGGIRPVSAPRTMLHAASLAFEHPDGGDAVASVAPPDDFAGLAAKLDMGDALDALSLGGATGRLAVAEKPG